MNGDIFPLPPMSTYKFTETTSSYTLIGEGVSDTGRPEQKLWKFDFVFALIILCDHLLSLGLLYLL
jgi:hypothetical protein